MIDSQNSRSSDSFAANASNASGASEYVAGTCNIGPDEIKRRKTFAIAGFVFFLVSLIGAFSPHATHTTRLGVAIPAMLFATGFVQARKKFCLAFGFAGTFNFSKVGQINKVATAEERKADRITAAKILIQSLLIAAILTGVVEALPLRK